MSTWEPNRPPQMSTWELNQPPLMPTWEPEREQETEVKQPELEAPLIKRQLKHRRNKDSKLAKKFKSLDVEISNLKSQMDSLKDKITRASESTDAGFKRKKIRSMKREANKIAEKLAKSEAKLESEKPRVTIDPIAQRGPAWVGPIRGAPLKLHPPNRSKCIETKIAELNKKIRRAKNRRNKERLIAKREALKAELN